MSEWKCEEKKPSNNTQKWKLCSFWDDDKGVFAWDVTLQRASLSHVTTELVLVKTAIIWLLDGGSLWKSPRLLLCLCLSVYERVRASVWNLCTMTFFCWKQVRGGGRKKKLGRHLFIVLITANKRNKDQFGKQRGFKQNNLWCRDFVVFLKKISWPFCTAAYN